MANGKNFTQADKKSFNAMGALENVSNKKNVSNISNKQNVSKTSDKRKYNKLDPLDEAPEVYRMSIKMPGKLGQYIAAKAHAEYKDRNDVILDLIEADMKAHPEVMREIEKAKKKRNK